MPRRVSAFPQGREAVPAVRECRAHSGLQLGSSKALRADVRAAAFVEGAGGQAEAADSDEGALQILLFGSSLAESGVSACCAGQAVSLNSLAGMEDTMAMVPHTVCRLIHLQSGVVQFSEHTDGRGSAQHPLRAEGGEQAASLQSTHSLLLCRLTPFLHVLVQGGWASLGVLGLLWACTNYTGKPQASVHVSTWPHVHHMARRLSDM